MANDSAQWKYPHVSVAKRRTGHRLCVWANYSWRALAQILSLAYPSQNFPLSISVGGEISASCTRPWLYPFHPILSAHRKKALSLTHILAQWALQWFCTDIEVYIGAAGESVPKLEKETLQPVQRWIFCCLPKRDVRRCDVCSGPGDKSGRINSSRWPPTQFAQAPFFCSLAQEFANKGGINMPTAPLNTMGEPWRPLIRANPRP